MALKINRSMLLVVESFGLLTGLAFLISGIGNALFFWLVWGINYFLIASPSDVVMSGFIVLTVVLVSFAFLFVLFLAAYKASKALKLGKTEAYLERQAQAARHRPLSTVAKGAMLVIVTALLFTIAMVESRSSSLPPPKLEVIPDKKRPLTAEELDETYEKIRRNLEVARAYMRELEGDIEREKARQQEEILAREAARRNFGYPTGLKLAPEAAVAAECRGGYVLWMGSDALVVACQKSIRVIRTPEGFVTEPIAVHRSPAEYATPGPSTPSS